MHKRLRYTSRGFTIVELLIVVAVIAILVAITVVAYNGIANRANTSALQSELRSAITKLSTLQVIDGSYPLSLPTELDTLESSTLSYTSDGSTYCLEASSNSSSAIVYHSENGGAISEGACPEVLNYMQTTAATTCSTNRSLAVDARDGHTYWVQLLADGNCWMLTNLAYAGGGTDTYGDTMTLTDRTSISSFTYTEPAYYVVPSTVNFTETPASPSESTTGTGQYGYLYNWCAAMGGQTGTDACSSVDTTNVDPAISICPSGWQLPTGNGGDQSGLNEAANGGATNTDSGLRTTWLLQNAGGFNGSFYSQGSGARYWSSTVASATRAYMMGTSSTYVVYTNDIKGYGFSVRCIATSL